MLTWPPQGVMASAEESGPPKQPWKQLPGPGEGARLRVAGRELPLPILTINQTMG